MPKIFILFLMTMVLFTACSEEVVKSDINSHYNNDYNNDNNDDEDCGNGVWDFGEECDGDNVPSCAAWHNDNTVDWKGGIICNDKCKVIDMCRDLDEDEVCDHDGLWEPSRGEACDGDDVPECLDIPEYADNIPNGYRLAGYLECSDCQLVPHCYLLEDPNDDEDDCDHDGIWEPNQGEECDRYDLPYNYCDEMPGFGNDWAGMITCDNCRLVADCEWVGSEDPACGDYHVDPNEACDRTNLNGVTCQDFGWSGGTLLCNEFCEFNTSQCN